MVSSSSASLFIIIAALVCALARAAPTDTNNTATLTQPETNQAQDAGTNLSPDDSKATSSTTTSKPVFSTEKSRTRSNDEIQPSMSMHNTSTFSCWGRPTGYYADVKLGCNIYHFCSQMEGIGETTYQRMSYVCMDGSLFDQKDLNCVMKSDLRVPCDRAEAEYESSNKQFESSDETQPSVGENLAANLLMNPISRFIAGR